MDWDALFLRYIWNKHTTPYFTAVDSLSRRQADNEILIFSLFLAVFFGVISLLATLGGAGQDQAGVALYGFTVVCAAVLFIMLKSYPAALYLSAAPVISIAYLFIYGMAGERAGFDTLIVVGLLLLFVRYALRVVRIARHYPLYPETGDP